MNLFQIVLKFGQKHFCDNEITNENVEDMFTHKINPKQIVNKLDEKPFEFFKVDYEYTTQRGNQKQGTKYFIFNTYNPEVNIEKEFETYIKEFNQENPKRQLLNVKFLRSHCLGYVTLNA